MAIYSAMPMVASSRYWHELPRGSMELAARLIGRIASTAGWRQRRLWDIAALAWQYEREKYLHQIGVGGEALNAAADSYPEFVRQRAGWLMEVPPSLNIIKSAVDTLVSRLFTELPAIEVLTENARHEEREAAEERTAALNATQNMPTADAVFRKVGRDGVLKGFGALRPRVEQGEVRFERIHQYQLAWDAWDARSGRPMELHYWCRVPKARVLGIIWNDANLEEDERKELYARVKALAPVARHAPYDEGYLTPYEYELENSGCAADDDALIWTETWRLPGAKGKELPEELRGRNVVAVHGGGTVTGDTAECGVLLHDGEWTRQTFPIVWWSPWPSDEGIDGSGVGHVLTTWQAVVDRTMFKVQRTLDKLSHTKVITREGVIKNLKDLLNQGIDVIEVPAETIGDKGYEVVTPQVLNRDELQWLQWVLENSQSWVGINAMLSQGGSRLGANAAAIALVEEDHRQLDRLADIDREFTEFRLRAGRETMNAIDDALEDDKAFAAQWRDADGSWRRRPWSQLIDDNAEYHLDTEAVGALGKTRSGRLAKIIDFAERQVLDPALASDALMSSPDIRRLARGQTAGRRLVEKQISRVMRGENVQPDRHVPPDLADQLALQHIQLAMSDEKEPDAELLGRLIAYREAVRSVRQEIADREAPAPAPGMDAGIPPALAIDATQAAAGAVPPGPGLPAMPA